MDLFRPNAYISIGGNKYGFVIVDDFSLFTLVFFLRDKGETQEIFKKFARRAQNVFEVTIKKVRSEQSLETPTFKLFLMKKASSMSSQFHTLHNKMVLWRERTEHSLRPQERCLMNTRFQKRIFGWKCSTQYVKQLIACTSTSRGRKPPTCS